jgi:hypothetical protein
MEPLREPITLSSCGPSGNRLKLRYRIPYGEISLRPSALSSLLLGIVIVFGLGIPIPHRDVSETSFCKGLTVQTLALPRRGRLRH